MKITPISLYNKGKQIYFKNDPTDEPVKPVQSVPTALPADTTQFQSAIKKTNESVLIKIARFFKNFFAEPKTDVNQLEDLALSGYPF